MGVKRRKSSVRDSLASLAVVNNVKYSSEEQVDGDIFDEHDPNDDSGAILRSMIDFKLCKKDNPHELVPLDKIDDHRGNLVLYGTVIEPLALPWREAMISLLSTTSVDSHPPVEASADAKREELNHSRPKEKQTLDWDDLHEGDLVDGFCYQTFKWYTTKIVTVDEANQRVKVHFQGWNSKYDEWISKYSERLVPYQTSEFIVSQAEVESNYLLPWFDCSRDLLTRAAHKLSSQPSTDQKTLQEIPTLENRRKVLVEVDGVEDICLDLSYGNPSLWIVVESGIWYRVAGALIPEKGCQGWPQVEYEECFKSCRSKYLVTGHTAMVLLDVLPSMPAVGLNVVSDEIRIRSSGQVNEVSMLENADFLRDQLLALTLPESWSLTTRKKQNIEKITFMVQLKKESELFRNCGGIDALRNGTYKGMGSRRRATLVHELDGTIGIGSLYPKVSAAADDDYEDPHASANGKRGRGRTSNAHVNVDMEPEEKEEFKPPRLSFPCDDELFWTVCQDMHQHYSSLDLAEWPKLTLPPKPMHSTQILADLSATASRFALQEMLLTTFSTLCTFRLSLHLPVFSLSDLEQGLSSTAGLGYATDLEREIAIALLSKIVEDKIEIGSLYPFFGKREEDFDAEAIRMNKTNGDDDELGKDDRQALIVESTTVDSLLPLACRLSLSPVTYSSNALAGEEVAPEHVEVFLREGETWSEVLRALYDAYHAKNLPSWHELIDSSLVLPSDVEKCLHIVNDIESGLLRTANKSDVDCDFEMDATPQSECSLLTDRSLARLRQIQLRLCNNWYDPLLQNDQIDEYDSQSALQTAENNSIQIMNILQRHDYSMIPGQLCDVFHDELHRWLEAIVIDREYARDERTCGALRAESYILRYVGWGSDSSFRLDVDSERIIPYKAASSEKSRRHMSPDEILSRYPVFESINKTLWDEEEDDEDDEIVQCREYRCGDQSVGLSVKSQHKGLSGFLDDVNEYFQISSDELDSAAMCPERTTFLQQLLVLRQNADRALNALVHDVVLEDFLSSCDDIAVVGRKYRSIERFGENSTPIEQDLDAYHLVVALKLRKQMSISLLSLPEKVVLFHFLSQSFLDTNFANQESTRIREVEMEREREKIKWKENDILKLLPIERYSHFDQDVYDSDAEDIDADEEGGENNDAEVSGTSRVRSRPETREGSVRKRLRSSLSAAAVVQSAAKTSELVESATHTEALKSLPAMGANGSKKPFDDLTQLSVFELTQQTTYSEVLGEDRFGNRYIRVSSSDSFVPMILREVHTQKMFVSESIAVTNDCAPIWEVISDPRDLWQLMQWLCARGRTEVALFKSILQWMVKTQTVAVPPSSGDINEERSDDQIQSNKKPDVRVLQDLTLRKKFSVLTDRKRTTKNFKSYDFEYMTIFQTALTCIDFNLFHPTTTVQFKHTQRMKALIAKYHQDCQRHGFSLNFLFRRTLEWELLPTLPTAGDETGFERYKLIKYEGEESTTAHKWLSRWEVHMLAVDLSGEEKSLGIGMKAYREKESQEPVADDKIVTNKDIDNWGDQESVYVTSLRKSSSLAQQAGVRVGDRILCVNDIRINHGRVIQTVVRSFRNGVTTDRKDNTTTPHVVMLLVMRRVDDPMCDPQFKFIYERDIEVQRAYWRQHQQDIISDSTTLPAELNAITTPTAQASASLQTTLRPFYRLLNSIVRLMLALDHTALLSQEIRLDVFPSFLYRLFAMARTPNCSLFDLCKESAQLLLHIDDALFATASISHLLWLTPHNKVRHQWRAFCGQSDTSSLTVERVSMAVAWLRASIDMDLVHHLTHPIASTTSLRAMLRTGKGITIPQAVLSILTTNPSLQSFASVLSVPELNKLAQDWGTLLTEGNVVVFYRQGYEEYCHDNNTFFTRFIGSDFERRNAVVWSPALSQTVSQEVIIAKVKQVKIFNSALPFAQVTLQVDLEDKTIQNRLRGITYPNGSVLAQGDVEKLQHFYETSKLRHLNRAIARAIGILKRMYGNQCIAFMTDVDSEEYPDYAKIVSSPMHLAMMEAKTHTVDYKSVDEFITDMELMYNNCVAFNGVDDMQLVPIARELVRDAKIVLLEVLGETTTSSSIPTNAETPAASAPVVRSLLVNLRIDKELPACLQALTTITNCLSTFANSRPELGKSLVSMPCTSLAGGPVSVKGVWVGMKPIEYIAGFSWLPWRAFKVDWVDQDESIVQSWVNPWQLDQMHRKTSKSGPR